MAIKGAHYIDPVKRPPKYTFYADGHGKNYIILGRWVTPPPPAFVWKHGYLDHDKLLKLQLHRGLHYYIEERNNLYLIEGVSFGARRIGWAWLREDV